MKNLKKTVVMRAMCAFLTVVMLCTDTGVTVYATEGAEEKGLEGAVEDISTGDIQPEDGHTGELPKENEQTEDSLTKEGEKEGSSAEEMPVKGETANENISEEDTEAEESVSGNGLEDVKENLISTVMATGDNAIASGEYKENGNDITWVIDADGKLTVEGTGDFSDDYDFDRAPWYNDRDSIKYAEVNIIGMTNADYMFYNCKNLIELDFNHFDTSNITTMSWMFSGCEELANLDLSDFNTSAVTDMGGMFSGCKGLTSLDLSHFDTGSVTTMSWMFSDCVGLTSLDLSHFDTSGVTNMSLMFWGSEGLTSVNLSQLSTSSVTNMAYMFYGCKRLKSLDLSHFDTSGVTDMEYMFYECSSLTTLDVRGFDTSRVTGMKYMFYGCKNLTSLDLSYFDTSNVRNMVYMFRDCEGLTSLDISRFNTSSVTDMSNMFESCKGLTSLDLSHFNTSGVIDMSDMFSHCESLTSLDLNNWDTGKVTDMMNMFWECKGLTNLDINHFDTSSVTIMGDMFCDCEGLTSLDLNNWDTSKVIDMGSMFHGCKGLTSLDISHFDTSSVADMVNMFLDCEGLTSLDLNNWNTGKVTDMTGMFWGCKGLTRLDLSHFDTSSVTDMNSMFSDCEGLTSLDLSSFDTGSVTDMTCMFYNCSNLTSLDLSRFNTSSVTDMSMFGGNVKLKTIRTPYNVKVAVKLPTDFWYQTWYQTDGTQITELPQNLNHSILIRRNKIPVFSAIEATKVKINYACDDTINTDDLTVFYYDVDGMAHQLESSDYITDVDKIDMSTSGEKILTITYNDGNNILTDTIKLTVTDEKPDEPPVLPIAVAVPTANPESGRQLTAGSKVTLTCETAEATIYYTIGSSEKELADPTEKSTRYTEPITINGDVYIKTVAIKGDIRSKTVTLHYTVADASGKVLKPYAIPGQGAVESGTRVELKSNTPDAMIYYVTGKNADMLGAVPVDNDHKYTGPVEIIGDMVIKAMAVKDGMENSDAATFIYKVKVMLAPPVAEPASGSVDRGSYISLKTDNGVNIYYTMDQSDPTTSGSAELYESMIRVDGDAGSAVVIRAAAEKKGSYSEAVTFTYTISENKAVGLQVMLAGSEEYTYTGSAIKPAVIVCNNGEELTEGTDYTVKYSNNVNAADKDARKAPKITVTGKGNLTKSRSITFTIKPKDIGDEEAVVGGSIVAVNGKTAAPVLFYNNVKMAAKDYVNPNAKKKYSADETITITGKGNFTGTRDIDVRVIEQKDLRKFTVVIDNAALRNNPLVYDGNPKTMDGYFKVYDTKDNKKVNPLKEYNDYTVIYPANNSNAGNVKFTVVGLGQYCGTITKTYTIKPRVVKSETDGYMEVNMNDGDSYPFKNGGVTIPGLKVFCDGEALVFGKDYKVSYSGNKKVCTNNKAKCTISFIGNYKGSKAIVRKFNITPAVIDDVDQISGAVSVAVGDKAYTGKRGPYKSVPYVTVDGALLKASDYKASYYKDPAGKQEINGKTAETSIELTDEEQQTVYVKIEGKGNYVGTLTAQYKVCKPAEGVIDLAKTRVTFVGGNKKEYTGEDIKPEIEVMYKSGKEWKKVDANDIGTYVKVTYINNVNKGKATVMINGSGDKYSGSKTAVFSITPKNMI